MSKVTIQQGRAFPLEEIQDACEQALDHFHAERFDSARLRANIDAARIAARATGDRLHEARIAWVGGAAGETRARDEWDAAKKAYIVADAEDRAALGEWLDLSAKALGE